jgi:hypothetical protein
MTKQQHYILGKYFTSIIIAVLFFSPVCCQDTADGQYRLIIHYVDKDSSFKGDALHLQTSFASQSLCIDYVNSLVPKLNMQGYTAASVDEMIIDSAGVKIRLYVGVQQSWIKLKTDSIEKRAIDGSGFFEKKFSNKPVNFTEVVQLKEQILNFYEKNGFPFASVYLDNLQLQDKTMEGTLKVNQGPLYHIDSIRVIGKAKIANHFLQRYLGIPNGSIYNREKLEQADKKIIDLPYVQSQQPSELLMLGTGSVLNLYLQPKRLSLIHISEPTRPEE